jgi:cell division protein FtsQ
MSKVRKPSGGAGGAAAHAGMMPYSGPWLRQKVTTYAFGTVICGALMVTFAAWMGGGLGAFGKKMDAGFTVILHSVGLTVEKIDVEGVDENLRDKVLQEAKLSAGQSMLSADPWMIRQRLEKMAVVGKVSVHRLWPNQVVIVAEAREPMALWRKDGQWSVIDQSGQAFAAAGPEQYLHLPKLDGEKAPEAAAHFISALSDFPELAARLESARRIGERRWDVRFKGGVELALPEDDHMKEALASVNLLNVQSRMLELAVTHIDARDPTHLALRPTPGGPSAANGGA